MGTPRLGVENPAEATRRRPNLKAGFGKRRILTLDPAAQGVAQARLTGAAFLKGTGSWADTRCLKYSGSHGLVR